MRYPASEKIEIIRLVEPSHLPVRRTLEKLGILPGSFYRWVDRYQTGGIEALEDKPSRPTRVWNRIPDDVRREIVEMALDKPELSPRELAARFTDTQNYFVSDASVYRLLKAHDLITSPAFIVIKAANEFKDKTTAINQLWQTDFTYLKVINWGWFYLSSILDNYSRYIVFRPPSNLRTKPEISNRKRGCFVGADHKYKIGSTRNRRNRLRSAKTWLPDMTVVGVKPFWEYKEKERPLHVGNAMCWYDGEWFVPYDEAFQDYFVDEFKTFSDADINRNSVDFVYWYNGSGMAGFVTEQNRQRTSLRKFQMQATAVRKSCKDE